MIAVKKGQKMVKRSARGESAFGGGKNRITRVVKRDGRVVPFDEKKITKAVTKAFAETGEGKEAEAKKVSAKVVQLLNQNYKKGYVPEIEEIQDLVERVLMILDFEETAKAYILYREQHRKIR